MSTALYDLTAPIFIQGLSNLAGVLKKGALFAEEQGIASASLVDARLFSDMAPLSSQIQRASDAAKGCIVRLSGVENVGFEDNEASFDQLEARIAKTIAFLETVPRDAIDGREDTAITLEAPNRSFHFTGLDYVLRFAQPNFYFHVTTAYAILRHKGVPVGKMDYLGGT